MPDTNDSLQQNLEGSYYDDRATALQDILGLLRIVYGDRHNIMVCHSQHTTQLNNIVFQRHMKLEAGVGDSFEVDIYVFDDGVFFLHGDGGYQNWTFRGNHDYKHPPPGTPWPRPRVVTFWKLR